VLHKLIIDLVRDDLKAMVARSDAHSTLTDAVVEFIAGGLFGVLMWWLRGKARLSGEELNALFRRFAIPAPKPRYVDTSLLRGRALQFHSAKQLGILQPR
jgi:hypothetical protein